MKEERYLRMVTDEIIKAIEEACKSEDEDVLVRVDEALRDWLMSSSFPSSLKSLKKSFMKE